MVLRRAHFSRLTLQHRQSMYGFIKGRSTRHCIISLMEEILKAKNDLEKAFELVDHSMVLYALAQMGMHGKLLAYVGSYLRDHKARVVYQFQTSAFQLLFNGVLQGGILSTLLFNCVIELLMNVEIPGTKLYLYMQMTAITCKDRYNVKQTATNTIQIVAGKCELGLKSRNLSLKQKA